MLLCRDKTSHHSPVNQLYKPTIKAAWRKLFCIHCRKNPLANGLLADTHSNPQLDNWATGLCTCDVFLQNGCTKWTKWTLKWLNLKGLFNPKSSAPRDICLLFKIMEKDESQFVALKVLKKMKYSFQKSWPVTHPSRPLQTVLLRACAPASGTLWESPTRPATRASAAP